MATLPLCGFCPFPPLVGLPVHTPCTRGVPVAGLGVASGMEVSTDKGQALEVTTRSRLWCWEAGQAQCVG